MVQLWEGSFIASDIAQHGAAILSSYSLIGTSEQDIVNLVSSMQLLNDITGNSAQSVTVLENVMQELANPDKQAKLLTYGINVRDIATGEFRDLHLIMNDIVTKGQEFGNLDPFGSIFGGTAMKAVRAFDLHGAKMEKFLNLTETAGVLNKAAANNASSLKANLSNLQTAFLSVANTGLDKPLKMLNATLNQMAKHPKMITALFDALVRGMITVAGFKGYSKIINLFNSAKNLKGGKQEVSLGGGGAGGAMPVYVTNLGGSLGLGDSSTSSDIPIPSQQVPAKTSKKTTMKGALKPSLKGAGGAVALSALFSIPSLINQLSEINKSNEDEAEKIKQKSESIGREAGSLGGAALGSVLGGVIGSIIPGVGTAIGITAGGYLGNMVGSMVGSWSGEKIGMSLASQKIQAPKLAQEEITSKERLPLQRPSVSELKGQGTLNIKVESYDYKTAIKTNFKAGTLPLKNTGSSKEARILN
ncbi:MAG: hypothetical protein ACRC4W_00610 [Treponemataceae bacterium]